MIKTGAGVIHRLARVDRHLVEDVRDVYCILANISCSLDKAAFV